MIEGISCTGNGHYRVVTDPRFGRQNFGYSPGGAQDRFSFETANILLSNRPAKEALEMILPPSVYINHDCLFVVTGGHFESMKLSTSGKHRLIDHAVVSRAKAGSTLTFGKRTTGFRSYLCIKIIRDEEQTDGLIERSKGDFQGLAQWMDRDGRMRVLRGPEFDWLSSPTSFIENYWKVRLDSNEIGLRLECGGESGTEPGSSHSADSTKGNMTSGPVNDGTIQLTPTGPILLLRDRQTVGGYPRILNVISADVDVTAQYAPLQIMRFRLVDIDEARMAAKQRRKAIEGLRCGLL